MSPFQTASLSNQQEQIIHLLQEANCKQSQTKILLHCKVMDSAVSGTYGTRVQTRPGLSTALVQAFFHLLRGYSSNGTSSSARQQQRAVSDSPRRAPAMPEQGEVPLGKARGPGLTLWHGCRACTNPHELLNLCL